MIRRYRQTKIVATIGPASGDEPMLRTLFETGVDVFRLNFSHGTHEAHAANVKSIRKIEEDHGRPIGIIADLQGPKLRIGKFESSSIELERGMRIRFDLDKTPGNKERVCLPHPEVIEVLSVDSQILLDDGKVRVRIIEKGSDFLIGEIEAGNALSNNKGFNIPGVVLPIPALTEKDKTDLEAALGMGVDWIAQSFVQQAKDVKETQRLINGRAGLIAKIEKPSAVDQFGDILEHVDAIMLARGDLGVEIPPEEVPAVQKRLVRHARHAGKPIIIATQMLESMITNARPTRAEASDVATAVYDGTDAVMLSAETATGEYPVEAVEMMDRICMSTENDETYRQILSGDHPDSNRDGSDAITIAAYYVAKDISAACIVNYTTSGSTALRTARQRPDVPILCLTQVHEVARRLCLSYGVRTIHVTDVTSFAETVEKAANIVKSMGFAHKGDKIVLTAGVPFGRVGSTNVLRIEEIS